MYAVHIIFYVEAKVDVSFPLQQPNFFEQINVMEDDQHNDLPTLSRSENIPIVSITKTLSQNVV